MPDVHPRRFAARLERALRTPTTCAITQRVHLLCRVMQRIQVMRPIDLFKATLFCGIAAYLVYTFPTLSQGIIIALLSLLWLSYLRSTVLRLRQR